jgi:hypothetical protein
MTLRVSLCVSVALIAVLIVWRFSGRYLQRRFVVTLQRLSIIGWRDGQNPLYVKSWLPF